MPGGSTSSQYVSQILLVDDAADHLEIIRTYLEDADPSLIITGVTTPKETLELLDEQRFDCIVSDYMMPGMNGIELAGKIRETSDIPFIIYTGQGSEEVAEAAFAVGIDDYMRKEQGSSHFKVLAKRIRSHVEHHQSRQRSHHYLERIEALHQNAAELAVSESVEEVGEIIFNTMQRVLGFELGGFSIVEDGKLKIIKSTISSGEPLELPLNGKGLSVRAVRTGETQLISDVRKDEDYLSLGPGGPMRSELDVPVKVHSGVVAVLSAISSTVSAFDDEDQKLVETLAMHVSSVLFRIQQTGSRREAEEKLKKLVELARVREAEKSAILNAIPDSLSMKDKDYRILWTNNVMDKTMGVPVDAVIGEICYEIAYGRDEPCDGCLFSRALESGERVRGEQIFADGSTRDVTVLPIPDKGGDIVGFVMSSRDITKRVRYEVCLEALHGHAIGLGQAQNEDEVFHRTIEAMEKTLGYDIAGILMVEKGRLIQVANNQLAPINVELPLNGKGVTVKAVRKKHSVLVDDVDESEDYFHLVDPLSGEPFPGYPPSQSELASPILLGEEAVGVLNAESKRRNAFTEEDVKLLETLAAHISAALGRLWNIERLEELVDERTREITYAERMTAAARVTAMVGHDLRGPLVTISNAAYLAKKSPEKAERMLTMIENNANRSIAMIEELRERLREKPLLLGMTDLGVLIRTAVEEVMIPDSVKAVLRLNDNLGSVMIDASQMRRVLDNLISNALDAMPGGGVLNVAAYRDGEAVRLEVSDTGVGISEGDMVSLFKPFHSGKSGGLGLGLAFCKQAVEAHGGVITVESEVAEGTLFTISLPLI